MKPVERYLGELKTALEGINHEELVNIASLLDKAREEQKTIFIFGNGGSGATASHFACDINKGVSLEKEKRFRVICLNDNIPTMLAYTNDIGYDIVFEQQLRNFLQPGDVVIGISGSGNSKNVLLAIEYANTQGAVTVGITGYDGGKLKGLVQHSFNANINDMQLSEDLHMIWVHIMMKLLA